VHKQRTAGENWGEGNEHVEVKAELKLLIPDCRSNSDVERVLKNIKKALRDSLLQTEKIKKLGEEGNGPAGL